MISGALVIISVIPYGIRTYQKVVQPNLTSWFLWTIIGFALLVTYKSSGAGANIWPAVFGFINPLIITLLVLYRRGGWQRPERLEIVCLILGFLSLGMWGMVYDDKERAQFALYLAIMADMCAAIPTIKFIWMNPSEDRPFAWSFYAVGYGLGIFAITEHTFANYILPVYMFGGALAISLPLAWHRLKQRAPLMEWV